MIRRTLLVLAPPILWGLQQQVNYALTASACEARAEWWLHVTGVAALVLVAGTTLLAWGDHRRFAAADETSGRFLAASGLGSGVFFLVVIVATDLPSWFLGACQR